MWPSVSCIRPKLYLGGRWHNTYNLTMNIDNLTNLTPANFGFVEDPDRPILSMGVDIEGPHLFDPHQHPRGQIILPLRGSYWVETPKGNWLVPPHQVIWIPPHLKHTVYSHETVTSLLLFVDFAYTTLLPQECLSVYAGSLLHELIQRMADHGNNYVPGGPEARFASVVLDELADMPPTDLYLPLSKDRRLARLMDQLVKNPEDSRSFSELAKETGASSRTLLRILKSECGISFTQWRTRLRMITAIDRLNQGHTITQAAFDLGYSSTSSFISAFRKMHNVTPGKYLASIERLNTGKQQNPASMRRGF